MLKADLDCLKMPAGVWFLQIFTGPCRRFPIQLELLEPAELNQAVSFLIDHCVSIYHLKVPPSGLQAF
jgi:hypothetical protein